MASIEIVNLESLILLLAARIAARLELQGDTYKIINCLYQELL